MTDREHALKTLWRERIHLDPSALSTSPREVQDRFETAWQLVEVYLHLLLPLPARLLVWWLGQPTGHIVISSSPSSYRPGVQIWRENRYVNVAFIATQDLSGSGKEAVKTSIRLLNHLFGTATEQHAAYFSQGFGLTPELTKAAQRFVAIDRLQYGYIELDISSADEYLAETLWLALYDRQTLNQIDPLLEKLYYQTLLDERFWSRQIALISDSSLPTDRTLEPR